MLLIIKLKLLSFMLKINEFRIEMMNRLLYIIDTLRSKYTLLILIYITFNNFFYLLYFKLVWILGKLNFINIYFLN